MVSSFAGRRRRSRRSCASPGPGFSNWCGRSESKVTLSPSARSCPTPPQTKRRAPSTTTAVSRLPGSCMGGSSGLAGRRAGRQGVQRDLGAQPGQRRGQHLVAVAPAAGPAAVGRPHDAHAVALVEAQQLRQGQLEPARDLLRHRQRGTRVPALDLRDHRRRDAAALGEVAQRQVHRLAEVAHPPTEVAVQLHGLYVITYVCMFLARLLGRPHEDLVQADMLRPA